MASPSSSSFWNSSGPCAACKFLRIKCLPGCIFAPHFPPEDPFKFLNVHKIFGASNIRKLLHEILPHQREDAVKSLAYEAEARLKDPVYGCVGAISALQRQVAHLQMELDRTNADLMRYVTVNEIPYPDLMFCSNQHKNDQYEDGELGIVGECLDQDFKGFCNMFLPKLSD